MSRAAVAMFTRSTYVIRYIAHRRPRTTVLAAGRLRRIVKDAIDYINELSRTGRHGSVHVRALSGHHDIRWAGTDLGNDGCSRPEERRRPGWRRAGRRHQL